MCSWEFFKKCGYSFDDYFTSKWLQQQQLVLQMNLALNFRVQQVKKGLLGKYLSGI